MSERDEREMREIVRDELRDQWAANRRDMRILAELTIWAMAVEVRNAKEEIMAAIDDLNASVGNLQTAVSDLAARVDNTQQEPAIAAAATAVQGAADTLNGLAQPPATPVVEPTP